MDLRVTDSKPRSTSPPRTQLPEIAPLTKQHSSVNDFADASPRPRCYPPSPASLRSRPLSTPRTANPPVTTGGGRHHDTLQNRPTPCRGTSYNGGTARPTSEQSLGLAESTPVHRMARPHFVCCLVASVATTHLPPAWRFGVVGGWLTSLFFLRAKNTTAVAGPPHLLVDGLLRTCGQYAYDVTCEDEHFAYSEIHKPTVASRPYLNHHNRHRNRRH